MLVDRFSCAGDEANVAHKVVGASRDQSLNIGGIPVLVVAAIVCCMVVSAFLAAVAFGAARSPDDTVKPHEPLARGRNRGRREG